MRVAIALLLVAGVARAQLVPSAAPPVAGQPTCDDIDLAPLVSALVAEINVLQSKSKAPMKFGARTLTPLEYSNNTLRPLYELAKGGDKAALCTALTQKFAWLKIGSAPILFTAYHTPTVRGSLTADDTYKYPLYKRPPGALAKSTTEQALGGALRGHELIWLADPYDALALHVEGAATITLPDGTTMALGTDGHNGQPYQNVSKLLAADGKMPSGPPPKSDQPGNPKARKYFSQHPTDLNVYWSRNAHFVFFKKVAKAGGGKLGALTGGRSIAIDTDTVPMGAVVWVKAQKPIVSGGDVTGWEPMQRIVLGQDTGAGIKGQRIDVYFGEDEAALAAAKTMSVQGEAWVLIAK
jgi:membrane-bound lytic murein transglycosylase A